jgi:chloramphenicol 3-O phosphotransferase
VTPPGRVIFLNGTSSSGKTTLGRALQAKLPGTWLLVGIDTFLQMLPASLHESDAGIRFREDGSITRGEEFLALYSSFRRAVRLLIDAGLDVIVDEVLLGGAADQAMWSSSLSGLDVRWIAVRCETGEVVRREAMRGDRLRNLALWQLPRVHAGVRYDFAVDTTARSPDAAAEAIIAFVRGTVASST